EVIDLFQCRLDARSVLVVLVRRVRRPVAPRREHLDGDQPVGVERVGGAEVVYLPGAGTGTAHLDRNLLGSAVAERKAAGAVRAGESEPPSTGGGHSHRRLPRHVCTVRDPAEDIATALEVVRLAVAVHGAAAGERYHHDLLVTGVPGVRATGGQVQYAQGCVTPTGNVRRDAECVRIRGRAAGGQVPLIAHSRLTAVSTAAATSPS